MPFKDLWARLRANINDKEVSKSGKRTKKERGVLPSFKENPQGLTEST
jgi:hypothetical protein